MSRCNRFDFILYYIVIMLYSIFKPEDKGVPLCFFTILQKITSLPPSGLGKQGDLQKIKLQYLDFLWGGEGGPPKM